jgi:hypothetical protein
MIFSAPDSLSNGGSRFRFCDSVYPHLTKHRIALFTVEEDAADNHPAEYRQARAVLCTPKAKS